MIDSGRRYAVIWISGPPGSGKTTLTSSYIESRKLPCLWYQMDEDDSDPATFFYYMGLAGKKAAPRKKKSLPLLTPECMPGLSIFTKRFFENLMGRLHLPSVIVLDNYQEVSSTSGLHEALNYGFSAIPEGISVIVLSRQPSPKEFARLRANEKIFSLGREDLRFMENETKGLMRLLGGRRISSKAVQKIYERSAGWAAGVVLLMQGGIDGIDEQTALIGEELFDYFAGEIFEKTDTKTQEFLLKTAFLSSMTHRLAEAVSGIEESGRILNTLYIHSYFTGRRPGPTYEYHPLFREFLRASARERFKREELTGLQRRAAALMEDEGRPEEAAEIFIEAGEWQGIILLIISHGPSLAGQGRLGLLEGWLRSLPEEILGNEPWLIYWMGVCRTPFDTEEARKYFGRAFSAFKAKEDSAGLCMAWAGVVETHIYDLHGWGNRSLVPWMREMERLLADGLSFPTKEVEARVTFCMFSALFSIEPWHEKISFWAERLKALLKMTQDRRFQIMAGPYIGVYYAWIGDTPALVRMFETLRLIFRSSSISPLSQLAWLHCDAIYRWNVNETSACLKVVAKAEEVVKSTGIHVLDTQIFSDGVYASLTAGDTVTAAEYLKKMHSSLHPNNILEIAHYYYLKAWRKTLLGDVKGASEDLEISVQTVTEGTAPFPRANMLIALADLLVERGELKRAESLLDEAVPIAGKMRSAILETKCNLTGARLAFMQGQNAEGIALLRKALGSMRKHGITTLPFWLPKVMADICARALEAGIEVDYVRDLIRKRGLTPEGLPLHVENWSWKLKVYTLGRFSAVHNGKPLAYQSGKGGKPLEMLKLLVTLGGRDVSEGRVADTLWPEAEGDTARRTFTTTLYRLRRIVGEDAVVLKDGRLTLSPRHCWADSWAFERLVSEAESFGRETTEESLDITEAAFRLYKGAFLAGEPDASWTVGVRERLRSKFVRVALKLGRYWERTGRLDRAVECYQKGIEVDCLVEEFYERLMECYSRLGRKAEALSMYRRYEKALACHLEIEPSTRMKLRYQEIKEGVFDKK